MDGNASRDEFAGHSTVLCIGRPKLGAKTGGQNWEPQDPNPLADEIYGVYSVVSQFTKKYELITFLCESSKRGWE
jgi:hypothetical protein